MKKRTCRGQLSEFHERNRQSEVGEWSMGHLLHAPRAETVFRLVSRPCLCPMTESSTKACYEHKPSTSHMLPAVDRQHKSLCVCTWMPYSNAVVTMESCIKACCKHSLSTKHTLPAVDTQYGIVCVCMKSIIECRGNNGVIHQILLQARTIHITLTTCVGHAVWNHMHTVTTPT